MNNNSNKKPKLNINRIKLATRVANNYLIYYPICSSAKNNTILHCNEFIEGEDGAKIMKLRCKRCSYIV